MPKRSQRCQNVYIVNPKYLRRSGGIRSARNAGGDGTEALSDPTVPLKKVRSNRKIRSPFGCAILRTRLLFTLERIMQKSVFASRTTAGNPPTRLQLFRR